MHKQAWREFSEIIRGTSFSDEEMVLHMFGRTNEEIIEYAIGEKPEPEMVEKYGNEKEALYRQRAIADKKNFHLAKGAVELLDFLKSNNIPRNIATMSDKTNVDFYFEHFDLGRWFDIDKVVYADGVVPSKPAPDIYQIAAHNIGLAPKDCIVVEDAISGIKSAHSAGIGKIIAICSEEPYEFYTSMPEVSEIIRDFDELDRNILKSQNLAK